MRGVPDATRDQQEFWDDRFYQLVFGIYLIWFLDVMSNPTRIGKPVADTDHIVLTLCLSSLALVQLVKRSECP
jgi:hypothetical protein